MFYKPVLLFLLGAYAAPSYAGGFELSDLIARLGGQFSGAGIWVQTAFAFIGLCLVGYGLFLLTGRSKGGGDFSATTNPDYKTGIVMFIFGALLLILTAIIAVATQSTFGAVPVSLDKIGL